MGRIKFKPINVPWDPEPEPFRKATGLEDIEGQEQDSTEVPTRNIPAGHVEYEVRCPDGVIINGIKYGPGMAIVAEGGVLETVMDLDASFRK